MSVLFVLYVGEQSVARSFWEAVLLRPPILDVPGMTQFTLGEGAVLGLMPEAGIRRLLPTLPDPAPGTKAPRAEVYLRVVDPQAHHDRVLAAGGVELSGLSPRNWGETVAYSLDLDGHVVAFADLG